MAKKIDTLSDAIEAGLKQATVEVFGSRYTVNPEAAQSAGDNLWKVAVGDKTVILSGQHPLVKPAQKPEQPAAKPAAAEPKPQAAGAAKK